MRKAAGILSFWHIFGHWCCFAESNIVYIYIYIYIVFSSFEILWVFCYVILIAGF